ncbi:MAG: hypothetical protein M0P61_03285 [Ignavibacteriaceae bacterium]|jgi:hypothetical protein|nr:hypothetical protein [Ignavibacteriaceae bacterium]
MKKFFANIYFSLMAARRKGVVKKFNGVLSGAKNFVLLMPEDETDFQNALSIAEFLLSKKLHVTLVLNNLAMHLIKDKSRYRIEEYYPTDKNKFGFPKIKLLRRLKIYSYDALISLEKESSLFQKFCADQLPAEIKIGLAVPGNDKVYGVQISVDGHNPIDFYKIFLNCLQLLY